MPKSKLKKTVGSYLVIPALGVCALWAAGCGAKAGGGAAGVCDSGKGSLSFHNNAGEQVLVALSGDAGSLPNIDLKSGQTVDASEPTGAYMVTVTGQTSQEVLLTRSYTVNCGLDTPVIITAAAPLSLSVSLAGSGGGMVSSQPVGVRCASGNASTGCAGRFQPGTMVTLTAQPESDSTFSGWSGACSGTGSCVVTMAQAASVTAQFDPITYSLRTVLAGNGVGSVSSQPAGIACSNGSGGAASSSCTATFDDGTPVTLTAQPADGSQFAGWTGGGCTGTDPCVTTVSGAQTVTAQFTLRSETLTVTRSGNGQGAVTSASGAVDCGATCSAAFDYGTSVILTAAAAAGSAFAGWSGACASAGTSAICVVTMMEAQAATAQFNRIDYSLSVSLQGNGAGTVVSQPAGISCSNGSAGASDCTATLADGTSVTLTAQAMPGSQFVGWTGGGCSGTSACTMTISGARTVTAQFTLQPETLTITRTGSGQGTVTSAGGAVACGATCSATLDYGTSVTLTAAATLGSTFAGWSGACASAGNSMTCVVAMSQAQTATARFDQIYLGLSVSVTGGGAGTVSSQPAGIDCGGAGHTSCTASVAYGAMVTLTPSPALGSHFVGWTGACSGTSPSCTVTVTAAATVAAQFEIIDLTFTLDVVSGPYQGGAGAGAGLITVQPSNVTFASDTGSPWSADFPYGTHVTVAVQPDTGTSVLWGGACTGSGTSCTVTMDQARTVTVSLSAISETLAVGFSSSAPSWDGGTVTSADGTSINCATTSTDPSAAPSGTCSFSGAYGQTVTLLAQVNAPSVLSAWLVTGGGDCAEGPDAVAMGQCTVTLTSSVTVTADIEP
jgi:uncharacterized repeat protein (TIGR02543 family)